ncbi:MAG: hypothetical protein WAX69_17325 [Victivallales bacterium]
MKQIQYQKLPIERLASVPGHYFFGYYDLQPWSADGRFHLCQRVEFMDRLQVATDRAELGMVRMCDGQFIPLSTTYAWNFQQGSMLQWNPAKPGEEIIYNALINNAFTGVIKNIVTGEVRILSRPIAAVDPTGRFGLSINFSRLFDFRPGYGYAGIEDPFRNQAAPEDDGIFLVDLATGDSKLIVSLASLRQRFANAPAAADKLMVNHITFNPDGSRFVFLLRNMSMPGGASVNPNGGWKTATLTANADGSGLHILMGFGMASHYNWRDPEHLLIWTDGGGRKQPGLYLLRDRSQDVESLFIDADYYDGHCSYSPDRNYILYDSYLHQEGYRKLLLYDLRKRSVTTLAKVYSGNVSHLATPDIRCDLHPRWNRDGIAISFDSIHEGHRNVYWMDLKEIL